MAEKLIQRGRMWYYRLTMADGRRVMQKGCSDKRETERMRDAAEIEQANIRKGLIDPKDLAYRNHEARPLAVHLDDWHEDLIAKRKTARHADQYRERAGKLIALVRGRTLAELVPGRKADARERAVKLLADTLSRSHFSNLTSEGIQRALAAIRDEGRSAQTANHHRAAIRAFLRWCFDKGRIREVPMKGVESFNVEEDLRHVRRSLTDDELACLIAYAEAGPDRWGMPGPLRAMAYRVAAATGFRVEELRSLIPESFRLDSVRPRVYLKASSTKNRKPADQPIARTVAEILRHWLQDKPPGQSVFPLHHETAKAIMADLDACGIPYETKDGVADFHSLRAYYVSALIRSGRTIKEVQQLARHAKPETTLNHYAKLSIHDLHNAVESLPDLTPSAPLAESLAATGTSGPTGPVDGADPARPILPCVGLATHQQTLAPSLLHFEPASGRHESPHDVIALSDAPTGINEKPPASRGFDASSRVLTALGAERGGFEPPRPVSQSNGLANRRYRPLSHLSGRGGSDPGYPNPRVPAHSGKKYQTAALVVNETMRESGTVVQTSGARPGVRGQDRVGHAASRSRRNPWRVRASSRRLGSRLNSRLAPRWSGPWGPGRRTARHGHARRRLTPAPAYRRPDERSHPPSLSRDQFP